MTLIRLIRAALLPLTLLLGAPAPPSAPHPRVIQSLNEAGWKFHYGDVQGVMAAGFVDSGWEKVSVPHTWNRIGEYALTRGPATNNKQGVGWYRLTYAAPPSAKGRRQYLDFAAVAIIADVWVNGVHVGQHKGAFSRFRFDVTQAWKPGAANLIVVKADNSKPAIGSTTQDVIPLAGDFFIHGGMYRGVQLIEANDVGIDLLDYGGPGVYVRPGLVEPWPSGDLNLNGNNSLSRLAVTVRLRNQASRPRKLTLRFLTQGSENFPRKFVNVPAGQLAVEAEAFIADPVKWQSRSTNQIEELIVEVLDGKRLIDSVTVPFGIRAFKFDANTGFTLNGQPLKLHGVSRHQDRAGKGYALSRADHAEDMSIMKEMGVNAVRMAHYQHDDAWAEEADKAGMVVWAEVPYVTTPSLSGGEGSAEVFANAEQQTRELIRQNYNHPSIMMWSVGNEVDASALFGLGGGATRPRKLLDHIARIAREEDPSRPTIFADCCEDVRSPVAGLSAQEQGEKLAGATDLIGYNRYYGWYYPEPLKAAAQLGAQMDKFHVKHPSLPISISEYGAGGAISQHSDNPTAGYVNATGRPQPEEYESWVHEQSWPVIRDRPFIFGSFVWNMFDFASDLRNEGDSVDINTKGLVTMDRKTRKDAFYYYKAQWNPEAMIHITGQRYVDRAYPVMDVKAYTNAPRAVLMMNDGVPLETDCPGGICVWPNIALRQGPNRARVEARPTRIFHGQPEVVEDTASWLGPISAQGIHLDAGDIAGHMIGTRRFGSDNFVTGGTAAVLNQGGFGGRGAPKRIVTAPDPLLYDYWREGEAFSYAIPLPDGKWRVTIHSFDPRAGAASAMMSVAANGKVALPAFNVSRAAGGPLRGLSRTFPVTVKGGVLRLDFAGQGGKAVVAAIEVAR